MLSQNNNALGIIFPNSYDNTVPELVTERTMASIPFAGRYRMGGLYAVQHGKLRHLQCLHRGAQELPLPDGSSGHRP